MKKHVVFIVLQFLVILVVSYVVRATANKLKIANQSKFSTEYQKILWEKCVDNDLNDQINLSNFSIKLMIIVNNM